MTNAELKKKISEAVEQEWFKTVSATFNFPITQQSFTGLSAIYEFVNQQIRGWETFDNLPSELNQSKTYFANIKNAIISFVNNYSQQNVSHLSSYWQTQVLNHINTIARSRSLPYDIPETEFLVKVYQSAPNYFQGTYHFLLKTNNYNVNNPDLLYGAILAYEFTLKDKTEITNRRKAEQNSISKIRTDFQKYLSESEQQLATHLNETNTNYVDYVKRLMI